jgi:putative ABC transport system ATP-binding protein
MIEIRDVRKTFKSGDQWIEALRGVSVRIPRGKRAFIVGPSGSGKSTLLYMLGGLDRPSAGEILVEGRSLTDMSEAEQNSYRRDKIGFIFQAFNLIGNLSAIDNVLVPFMPRGVSNGMREKAANLLAQVGLKGRLNHRPYQLSGGEQQRVAIARALIKDPILVLADEPTGELDSRTGDEIYRILRRLQKELHSTLVVVTHDRRFITPDDLVLEIQDGLLVNGDSASGYEDDLAEPEIGFEANLR